MYGYESTVTEDKTKFSVSYHGYNYSHLDRNYNVTSTRTCSLPVIWGPPGYMEFDRLRKSGRIYIKYFKATIHPNLINSRSLVFSKVQVERELVHVGNSSYIELGVLKAPDMSTVLSTSIMSSVHVDEHSRKKKALPKWFCDKYGHFKQPYKYLDFPDLLPTWDGKVKVQASETDSNDHTNFASYITYCEDAVYKYYKNKYDQDYMKTHSLQSIEINYLGDSVQGDELQITLSENPTSNNLFYISFQKNSYTIVQCKLAYCRMENSNLTSFL